MSGHATLQTSEKTLQGRVLHLQSWNAVLQGPIICGSEPGQRPHLTVFFLRFKAYIFIFFLRDSIYFHCCNYLRTGPLLAESHDKMLQGIANGFNFVLFFAHSSMCAFVLCLHANRSKHCPAKKKKRSKQSTASQRDHAQGTSDQTVV